MHPVQNAKSDQILPNIQAIEVAFLAQITSLTKEVGKLKNKVAGLKAEKNELEKEMKKIQAANYKYEAQWPALKSKLEDKMHIISVLEATIQDLRKVTPEAASPQVAQNSAANSEEIPVPNIPATAVHNVKHHVDDSDSEDEDGIVEPDISSSQPIEDKRGSSQSSLDMFKKLMQL